ncbi:MAG: class II aldolase/adducin family protein [Deltaproteobacteria bacterium]|nr:class II aldolase/adducin family protein [Deltaproteobacteria bacterium]MBW2136948.1 class II aldolase/adducin family protein [Deltaproteobacteria bacterium]
MADNMQEEEGILRKELSEYGRRSFERGLICGTGGNLSARIPGTDKVLVTPTGISLGDVRPNENILVSLDGEVLDSPMDLIPSKETSFHLRAYRLRPDINAVAHLHPPYATAYANKGIALPLVTVSARANLKHVPTIECALPGSEELCELVTKGLGDYPEARTLLMKEHGILALGKDLKTAFYLADLVEDTAKVAFIAANIKF